MKTLVDSVDMIEWIDKIRHGIICFMKKSHRGAHLAVGFLSGLFFTLLFTAGFALGMEAKEVQADRENIDKSLWKPWALCWRKFDWIDFGLTAIGGVLGSIARWLIVWWIM